jgi:hypothetical protein
VKIGQSVVTTTTNISDSSKRGKMTVDPRGFGKIMSMLSNQYSDRALAVVREYFCNGDDSRMAAGSDRPTEVLLPTDLNPEIIIRDYGTGLTVDELTTIYSTYTTSTKDDENTSTGGFGIGSKVGFTLGQQFTVTGFKDGRKAVVLFFLSERGEAEWDVRYEGDTDEPNGVLVSVGVPDVAAMRRAAERFFLTVPKGRALVDGQPPKHLSDVHEFVRFNDEVIRVKDGNGEIRLQMGPVTYRVSKSILQAVYNRLDGLDSQRVAKSLVEWDQTDSVLMEVPVGSVEVAPSREDLIDTDDTVNQIAAIVQGIHDFIVTDVQRQVDAQRTMWRAYKVLTEALDSLKGFKVSRKAFTFGGAEAVFKKEVKVEAPTIFLRDRSWRSSFKIVEVDKDHTVDARRMDKTLVVAGVLAADVSKVKRYAKRFIEENEQGIEFIVVTEEFSGEVDWFQWGIEGGVLTYTLDEYRAALRSLRDSNPRTANEPSYTTGWHNSASRDLDDRDLLTDIISWGKDIVIFHEYSRVLPEVVEMVEDLYTPVVLLAQQSENALRKRVEADGSVKVIDGDWEKQAEAQIAAKVKAEIPEPTMDERIALGAAEWIDNNEVRRYVSGKGYATSISNWRADLIDTLGGFPTPLAHPLFDNPRETEELARLMAADLTEDRKEALQRLQRWTGVEFEAVEFEAEDDVEVSTVFPLLVDRYGNIPHDEIRKSAALRSDVIAYINSKA